MPSPAALALRRFSRHPPAILGLIILLALAIACFASIPWTKSAYADQHQLQHVKEPPSRQFPLGTDALGRDLTARFLLGGAISLSIGIASALIAILIGASVGLLAGYAGGRTDAFLMRVVDVMYGLPYILLVILMRVSFVAPLESLLRHPDPHGHARWLSGDNASNWANILILLIGIGAVSWLTMARVIRGQVLSLRNQPFVEAARALGLPPHRILLRHILPNLLGTIIVYGTLTVPNAILSESFLSFLGLGVQDPLPSWGNLAAQGIDAMNPVHTRWWLITWPCLGLSLALLSLNFLGDALHDSLSPRRS
ncbi:MAG TPA: ABC transporter permease [Phycisphaerae bacterium]|nr:ABC transporter permease [Phycisphaerae bacterium]